jgi:hypothetical protein
VQHLQRCSSAGLCSELANGSSNRHIADQTTAIPLVGLGGHVRGLLCAGMLFGYAMREFSGHWGRVRPGP